MPILQRFPSEELHEHHYFPDFQPFSLELSTYTERIRYVAMAFFIAGALAICTTLSFELWQTNSLVTTENAWLEIGQGGLLVLAMIIQGVRAFTAHESELERDIRLGLALFAFALFLREVDIGKFGASEAWGVLEKVLRAIALMMALGFALQMSRRIKLVLRNFSKILLSPSILISILACVFYACGWPFDKELFKIDKSLSLWIEETFEFNACLLLFAAGLASNNKMDKVEIPERILKSANFFKQFVRMS